MTNKDKSKSTKIAQLRKEAQKLRWFINAFSEHMERTEKDTGNSFNLSQEKLVKVFHDWLKSFEHQKPKYLEQYPSYVGFASGLMLKYLLHHQPVEVKSKQKEADNNKPEYFWPEGYLYVGYCLNIRSLVLDKDFGIQTTFSEDLQDLRTWWSFKENISEDTSNALAFLDLFAGSSPNWNTPNIFRPLSSDPKPKKIK